MVDQKQSKTWPLWVRCVAREGMKRSAARTQITSFVIGSGGGLFFICSALLSNEIQPAAPSFLSEFGLPIGLVLFSVGVPGAIWCWLGMRWVDKNGSWA